MDGEFDLFPHQIKYIFFGKIFSKSDENIHSELVSQLLADADYKCHAITNTPDSAQSTI